MLAAVTPLPLSAALERLVRASGGAPLLTHYGPAGARTELSAASFANWVDKTGNLLDDVGLDAGARVALPLLLERPAHWMALLWPFALWSRGMAAHVAGAEEAADADLAVIGPDAPRPLAPLTIACSLDPWGRPLAALPAGVTDFSGEALAQPDLHVVVPAPPGDLAWADADRRLTFADLAALEPVPHRVASAPRDAWTSVSLLSRAIAGGGSLVCVEDPDADLARVAASERARVA